MKADETYFKLDVVGDITLPLGSCEAVAATGSSNFHVHEAMGWADSHVWPDC